MRRPIFTNDKINWKHALSEIAFIFIGISLAIWFQNWNDRIRDQELEQEYLRGFKHDLEWDQSRLNGFIVEANQQMEQLDSILVVLENGEVKDAGELRKFFFMNFFLTRETYFVPEKSTYNQLLSSSHGHVVQDKALKDRIFRYYTSAAREENNNERSVQLYQHHWVTPNIINAIVPTKEGIDMNLELSNQLPALSFNNLQSNEDYLTALVVRREISNVQKKAYGNLLAPIDTILSRIDMLIEDVK
ncbi:MAG: hypothetical protein AAF806_21420 [Bacteroidota bacterium]